MGVINPDATFLRNLKNLSSDLDCHFDNKDKRFVITCKRAVGGSVAIYQIKTDDNQFRKPDDRDIAFIASGDNHKTTSRERTALMAKYMEDYHRDHQKKTKDDFRDRTKDDKFQLARKFAAMTGCSKKMHPFRNMAIKPKGKVF